MKNNYEIPKSVLFVCSGNSDRSPMAEYMFRELTKQKGLDLRISSRGVRASYDGTSFDKAAGLNSIKVLLELFPHLKEIYLHSPTQLKKVDLLSPNEHPKDGFDLILTMEEDHREDILCSTIANYVPDLARRVFALREYVNVEGEIPDMSLNVKDPVGGGGKGGALIIKGSSIIDTRDVSDWTSAYDTKGVKGSKDWNLSVYRDCRNQVLACLNKIIDGKVLTLDEILEYRRLREDKIEERIEAERILWEERERKREEESRKKAIQKLLDKAEGKEVELTDGDIEVLDGEN